MQSLPPGPKSLSPFGCYRAFKRDPLAFLRDLHSTFGDTVRFRLGRRTYFSLQRPDHAQEILLAGPDRFPRADAASEIARSLGRGLVTTDGREWSEQRRALQPPFAERKVGEFYPDIVEALTATIDGWRDIGSNSRFNVTDGAFQLAMSVAAKCFLGIEVESDTLPLRRAIETLGQFTMDRIASAIRLPLWLPFPSHRAYLRARQTIDDIVYRVIEERRRTPGNPDLVSRMLHARVGETRRPLTNNELRDQLVTIFLAGFDTTAASLAITVFLLANHPDVLLDVQREVDNVVTGSVPTFDNLNCLPHLRAVILESLRLYPTVPLFSRVATEQQRIGRYDIPSATEVWICPYIIHRHRDYRHEPEEIQPTRWQTARCHPLRLDHYMPFGKGPHTCIGASFALLEIQAALAAILRCFAITAGTRKIRPVAKIALGTREDIRVRLATRTASRLVAIPQVVQ